MAGSENVSRSQMFVLWTMIAAYALGRICQQYPGTIPVLGIVSLQVVPPAVFALVHASILYGVRGMLTFTAFCLGVAGLCESLSLRTGFPFGHYFFTGLMGPKVLEVPILLVLAYVGIGYCSWVVAVLILGYRDKPIGGARVAALPLLAALIMMAWDLSMDPIWATLDKAWMWRDGGVYFGVPISNFLGWYLTAYLFYQAFALYLRANPTQTRRMQLSFWRAPVVVYGICALGNLLVFREGLFAPTGTDATGRVWITGDILMASVVVSLLVMTPFAVLAWWRSMDARSSGKAARDLSA
jgi:putative membrane protein